jgi:NAD(P)H-dependent flavin oxidoreductase YrpB (nitropropane dioxygenase family)
MAMGDKLRQTFLAAKLPEPQLRPEARIGGGAAYTGYDEIASVVRSLLPLILKFAIATAAEVEVDAIIAQGSEAGGQGLLAGVGMLALLPQVVDAVRPIPALATGSIADGRGLAAAVLHGAQGVNIGTRFLASTEASAALA